MIRIYWGLDIKIISSQPNTKLSVFSLKVAEIHSFISLSYLVERLGNAIMALPLFISRYVQMIKSSDFFESFEDSHDILQLFFWKFTLLHTEPLDIKEGQRLRVFLDCVGNELG